MGNECFAEIDSLGNNCKPNCQGLYADVVHRPENSTMKLDEKGFEMLFKEYAAYKTGFEGKWVFSGNFDGDLYGYLHDLKGTSFTLLSEQLHIIYNLASEQPMTLHYVNIYFSTPTFDKIIEDERASSEAKLSLIGGTMGLLNGFSILSAVEILYFILRFLLKCFERKTQK